jgi:cytochrome c-type biogenesis protein CcmH/NrfG
VKAVLLCTGLLAALPAAPASPVGDAVALYKQKRYVEARSALERIVASDPSNAEACYFLAMAVQRAAPPSLDSARALLGKAIGLAPDKERYLAEYARVTLLMADRDSSFGLAREGRDAMARAVAMDPSDLDACFALMRFCAQAPWPLGNAEKALGLAGQIAARDPGRGLEAYRVAASIFDKQGRARLALAARQAAERLAQPGAR